MLLLQLNYFLLFPFCLLSLAGYVEALASRLGMQIPDLSPKQADMWQTRVSSHAVGIETLTTVNPEFALPRTVGVDANTPAFLCKVHIKPGQAFAQ